MSALADTARAAEDAGIGAAWHGHGREHLGLGVPFPPLANRFERLEETCRSSGRCGAAAGSARPSGWLPLRRRLDLICGSGSLRAAAGERAGADFVTILDVGPPPTPAPAAAFVEEMRPYADLGIRQIVLIPFGPDPVGFVDHLAGSVVPQTRRPVTRWSRRPDREGRGVRRLAVAVVVLATAAMIVAGLNSHRLELVWKDVVLDSRSTRIPCDRRPPAAQARQVLAQHDELVRQIQAVDQSVFVSLEDSGCPGRGTLVIAYGAHRHRKQIERLIGGDTFFGVPYSLRNV